MAEDFVTRTEFTQGLERVHTRVDAIAKTGDQIEISAKNIEKSVCDLSKIMFGSEKADGIITKVSNLKQKVSGVYWFLGIVIVACVGTLVSIALTAAFSPK